MRPIRCWGWRQYVSPEWFYLPQVLTLGSKITNVTQSIWADFVGKTLQKSSHIESIGLGNPRWGQLLHIILKQKILSLFSKPNIQGLNPEYYPIYQRRGQVVNTRALYSGGSGFECRPIDRVLWQKLSLVSPGKCWDSTIFYAMTTSFHIRCSSSFTYPTIESYIAGVATTRLSCVTNAARTRYL
jgi:hypothetical protein